MEEAVEAQIGRERAEGTGEQADEVEGKCKRNDDGEEEGKWFCWDARRERAGVVVGRREEGRCIFCENRRTEPGEPEYFADLDEGAAGWLYAVAALCLIPERRKAVLRTEAGGAGAAGCVGGAGCVGEGDLKAGWEHETGSARRCIGGEDGLSEQSRWRLQTYISDG